MTYQYKEAIEKLYRGYINIRLNPQSQHRKDAVIQMTEALNELQSFDISFDALAEDVSLQNLLMLTGRGMIKFIDFVHKFKDRGYDDMKDISDIVDEQRHIAKWVNEHKKELIR